MTDTPPDPAPATADWEAFYANYRKPGYVRGFEITTKLGAGMFGLVYKATRQSIGKDYAVKFLKVDDGEVRRAVLQELDQVRLFAQIDHPNLVAIEDKGEVDGIPYIVMAYAGSQTLRDLLPASEATRGDALNLLLQAARGVAALHEHSLVHFDLKPANVFLKGGVARVGDYGLSKLVTHSQRSLSMGRGTPYYMAPEMLQRKGDRRSDVYSLGVMLYEVLCGDVPFKGDSEWEVLKQHETATPSFPPHVSARERAIVLRCMHKDPDQRYQQIGEMLADFGAPVGVGAASLADSRVRPAVTPIAEAPKFALPLPERPRLEAAIAAERTAQEQRQESRKGMPFREPPPRQRSWWRSVFLTVSCLLLVMCVWGGARPRRVSTSIAAAPGEAVAPAFPSEVTEQAASWARQASRDLSRAKADLERQIARFRAEVPVDALAMIEHASLPVVVPEPPPPPDVAEEIEGQLRALELSPEYDPEVAEELSAHGVAALRAAASALQGRDLATTPLPCEVQNLQRFLQESTGMREIRLVEDPGIPVVKRLRANTSIPNVWLLYLERFAPDDATWKVYRKLRSR